MRLPTAEEIRILIPDASRKFLPQGASFDDESMEFICNLDTKDIIACPGSGKTTALIAKLYILSRFMPFPDNQGICVLTHTNVAIDEIKLKMGVEASILFAYPNFFGTIQEFTDKFLAIPEFLNLYGMRPVRFDDEYVDKLTYSKLSWAARSWLSNQYPGMIKDLRLDDNFDLRLGINGSAIEFPLKDKNKDTYKSLLKAKCEVFSQGYLKYDEAFWLADSYVNRNQSLCNVFSMRFCFAFIDEIQDTTALQMNILDKVFVPPTVFQRIGDPNQAIYNFARADLDWNVAPNPIRIPNSKRLSCSIASAIRNVCILPENLNGDPCKECVPPTVIMFSDPLAVIPKFSELIRQHRDKWQNIQYPIYKAVGWVGQREDENRDKLWIGSYFPDYQKPKKANKTAFDSLKNYLLNNHSPDNNQANQIYNSILSGLLRTLEILKIKRNSLSGKLVHYSKDTLLRELADKHPVFNLKLLEKAAKWAKAIYSHGCNPQCEHHSCLYAMCVWLEIIDFIKDEWATIMQFDADGLSDFIDSELDGINSQCHNLSNSYAVSDISIKLGTVHSVKGETHTATLYLESYFNRSFESKRLIDYFVGIHNAPKNDAYTTSLKVCYVGLSRPTHLLCVAFQNDHVSEANLMSLQQNGWIIERV